MQNSWTTAEAPPWFVDNLTQWDFAQSTVTKSLGAGAHNTVGETGLDVSLTTQSLPLAKKYGYVFYVIAYSLVLVLGTTTNFISIMTFVCFKSMRTVPHMLITNLECIDFIFSVITSPPIVIGTPLMRKHPIWGDYYYCRWWAFWTYLAIGAQPLAALNITLNRFVAIVLPFKYKQVYQTNTTLVMICVNWAYPTLLMTLAMTRVWGNFAFSHTALFCTITKSSPSEVIFNWVYNASCGYFSIITMVVLYIIMFGRIKYSNTRVNVKSRKQQTTMSHTQKTRTRDIKLAKTAALVCLIYVFTLLPFYIVAAVDKNMSYFYLRATFAGLMACNAFFNFFIYIATNKNYRKAYLRLLCCKWKQKYQTTTTGGASTTTNNTVAAAGVVSKKRSAEGN